MSVYWDYSFRGMFFIFLSDLCVEADTLVYFHSPITPTATRKSRCGPFQDFCRFVPFVDGMLSTAFSSPAHGDGRDSKTDGDVGVCAGGTDVQGFHANGLICSICSLDNLAGFFLGTRQGACPFLFEVTVMRSSSAEVCPVSIIAFTGTAPAVSPTLLFAVILLSSRIPVLSELKSSISPAGVFLIHGFFYCLVEFCG